MIVLTTLKLSGVVPAYYSADYSDMDQHIGAFMNAGNRLA